MNAVERIAEQGVPAERVVEPTITLPRGSRRELLSLHGDGVLYEVLKRILDIVVAASILIVGVPLWLLIALAIKLHSPGPALYVEKREIGKNGRPFKYYKFRSMHVGRDESMHRQAFRRYMEGQALGTTWDRYGNPRPVFKLVNDPRINGLGRWLRKSGLDEVPQLINVLKGDMSLVGPRPAIWYEWEMYRDRCADRLSVIPGITGYYQVYGRADVGFAEMCQLDREYIAHRSLWLDLKIMLRTPWIMLTGKGAH